MNWSIADCRDGEVRYKCGSPAIGEAQYSFMQARKPLAWPIAVKRLSCRIVHTSLKKFGCTTQDAPEKLDITLEDDFYGSEYMFFYMMRKGWHLPSARGKVWRSHDE